MEINAAYIQYNANTRDARVGDCVKRGLSVGYGLDYDEVSRELNKLKRELRVHDTTNPRVLREFVARRGDKFVATSAVTADEYCKSHRSGVHLILLSRNATAPITHVAAVLDRDLYDSWNSSSWIVREDCELHNVSSTTHDFDCIEAKPELTDYANSYLAQLESKCPDCMNLSVGEAPIEDVVDRYTFEMYIWCRFGETPKYSGYRSNCKACHILTLKCNPRMSLEENITKLKGKIKQKLYDWVYNIRRDILDAIKLESLDIHHRFRGDVQLLAKFPDWAIPHIVDIYKYQGYTEVEMEPLPGDPREDSAGLVLFSATTLTELKRQMQYYHEDFSRHDYDY